MKIARVDENSKTAGLSPTDMRTEVFFAGCKMAHEGNPCPDCFNTSLWDPFRFSDISYKELFRHIEAVNNKFVTIVGGEPLDQYPELVQLLRKLRRNKYHVVLITHFTMHHIEQHYPKVLRFANVIIDGMYNKNLRAFDEDKTPGIYNVVGSFNQNIWHNLNCNWYKVKWTEECLRFAYCTGANDLDWNSQKIKQYIESSSTR